MVGDAYITCDNNFLTNHALLQSMIYIDSNGKPALLTDSGSSSGLSLWINCDKRRNLSIDQLLRLLIVEDEDGKPAFNVI